MAQAGQIVAQTTMDPRGSTAYAEAMRDTVASAMFLPKVNPWEDIRARFNARMANYGTYSVGTPEEWKEASAKRSTFELGKWAMIGMEEAGWLGTIQGSLFREGLAPYGDPKTAGLVQRRKTLTDRDYWLNTIQVLSASGKAEYDPNKGIIRNADIYGLDVSVKAVSSKNFSEEYKKAETEKLIMNSLYNKTFKDSLLKATDYGKRNVRQGILTAVAAIELASQKKDSEALSEAIRGAEALLAHIEAKGKGGTETTIGPLNLLKKIIDVGKTLLGKESKQEALSGPRYVIVDGKPVRVDDQNEQQSAGGGKDGKDFVTFYAGVEGSTGVKGQNQIERERKGQSTDEWSKLNNALKDFRSQIQSSDEFYKSEQARKAKELDEVFSFAYNFLRDEQYSQSQTFVVSSNLSEDISINLEPHMVNVVLDRWLGPNRQSIPEPALRATIIAAMDYIQDLIRKANDPNNPEAMNARAELNSIIKEAKDRAMLKWKEEEIDAQGQALKEQVKQGQEDINNVIANNAGVINNKEEELRRELEALKNEITTRMAGLTKEEMKIARELIGDIDRIINSNAPIKTKIAQINQLIDNKIREIEAEKALKGAEKGNYALSGAKGINAVVEGVRKLADYLGEAGNDVREILNDLKSRIGSIR